MIRLYIEDWATNAGILGFYRVLKHAGTNLFEVKGTNLDFNPRLLQHFHTWFFDYAFKLFSVADQKESRMNTYINRAQSNFKRYKDLVFIDIKTTETKLSKRLPAEASILKKLTTKKKDVLTSEELKVVVDEYIKLLYQKQVNEVLTLNMIRYRLGELHGQTSFLQKSRSTLNRSEHEELFMRDFIQPILLEQEILSTFSYFSSPSEAIESLKGKIEEAEEEPLKVLSKQIILKLKKNELLYCPVIEGQLALTDYTEAIFLPNAVSIGNATNYSWNNQISFPISNLYRLIMFCSVFALYKDEENTYTFIQVEENLRTLIEVNDLYITNKEADNPFEAFIYDTLKETKEKVKWISKNMLIIEFQSSGKKTVLTHNFLSELAVQYIQERGGKDLDSIKYAPFRNRVLRRMLNGESFFRDITNQLRENVKNNYSSYDTYAATLVMFHINRLKECYSMSDETKNMQESSEKRLYRALADGREVRKYLTDRGMENKIPGITYRLLNSLSTNNRQQFFETLFRTFLLVEKNTSMYVDVTRPNSVEFEGIASALLSGLNDRPYNKREAEETK